MSFELFTTIAEKNSKTTSAHDRMIAAVNMRFL